MAYSSVMRYTGLSGVDTTSMVEAMMSVHTMKYDTLYQKNASYRYKQEAYQSAGNALIDIQKKSLDSLATNSLRKTSTFLKTKTTVTDKNGNASGAVSVKLGTNAKNFNQSIEIKKLATADKFTIKGNGSNSKTATDSIDFDKLTLDEDGSTSMNITLDGVTRAVKLSSDQLDGIKNSSDPTKAFADELNNSLASVFGANASGKASFGVSSDGNITMKASAGHTMKLSSTDGNVEAALGFGSSNVSTNKNSETTMQDMFGINTDTAFVVNGKSINVTADMTVDSFVKSFNEIAGDDATMSFNSMTGNFAIEAKKTGEVNSLKFGTEGKSASEYLSAFGSVSQTSTASDAEIYLGGDSSPVYLENNNMTLSDGTSITFNSVTEGAVDVNTTQDTDSTKSAIKSFVDMYNSLLTAIYDQTRTTRPTSTSGSLYNPLTEEQEKEMSATEIENWEAKAKTGLLYKDKDLKAIETSLRSVINKSITLDDGTSFKLSDVGINLTADYSKGGLLTLDEEKMDKALENIDVTNIAEAFASSKGYANQINTVLNKTVGLSGTLTAKVGLKSSPLYMAKNVMTERIKKNAFDLADMQKWLVKKEDMYFKKFSYMEKAITNSNSQLSSLGLGQ